MDCDVGVDANEDMDLIGHQINLNDLLFPVCYDAGGIWLGLCCSGMGDCRALAGKTMCT